MVIRKIERLAATFVIGFAFGGLGVSAALAQASSGTPVANPSPAQAASPAAGCFVAPAALSSGEIAAFLSSPAQLLADFPTAGLPMANRVRSLAGSSSEALKALTNLVAQANPSQIAAIGAGLARAARACAAVDPLYAGRIQEAVAGTPFETAFLSASSETQTAALGAAGAGGGAAAGAIGGAGAGAGAGTGLNGATGDGGGVASGDSAFAAGASSRYFASSGAGSTIIIQASPTFPRPAQ